MYYTNAQIIFYDTELLHRRGDEHLEEVQTLCRGQLEQV